MRRPCCVAGEWLVRFQHRRDGTPCLDLVLCGRHMDEVTGWLVDRGPNACTEHGREVQWRVLTREMAR